MKFWIFSFLYTPALFFCLAVPWRAYAADTADRYSANHFIVTRTHATAAGGERIDLGIVFQNTGTASWSEYAIISGNFLALASADSQPAFADDGWQSPTVVVERKKLVHPDDVTREDFFFRAPARAGAYAAVFQLRVNGAIVPDAGVEVSVDVTSNAAGYTALDGTMPAAPEAVSPRFAEEPRIRVGIWKPQSTVQFVSDDDDYTIYGPDFILGVLPKGTRATLSYADGAYILSAPNLRVGSSGLLRLSPVSNPHAVFSLPNYDRRVPWKGGSRTFNAYRGAMEYRRTQSGTLYVINDLLFEDYVAGIAETSNVSHIEYIKALLTAARTYAYYVKENTTKHDTRNFDVVATTGDQLYLGYVSEMLMPRVAAAARDTRGYMVTYHHDIVITPYFAHSDGRTRSWTDVWGGREKPWLVSVPAVYDQRDKRKKAGHGVGMSARDASIRADTLGEDWKTLLKYYYTGADVERVYP